MDKKLKKLTPDLFVCSAETDVRYRDLDTLGHVNNGVYVAYMEFGRTAYFHRYLAEEIDWKTKGFVIGTNHIVYAKPLYLFDKVRIFTGIGKIGEKSITAVQLIQNQRGDNIAYAYSVLVALDFVTGKTIPVPADWKKKMSDTDKRLLAFFQS